MQSTGKEKEPMSKKNKKPIKASELAIQALIDLIVGIILILIDKYIG